MSDAEIHEGESAVEAKLSEFGADQIRRPSFTDAPEAAPADQGTPVEEVAAQPRNELGQFAGQEPDTTAEAPAEETASESDVLDPALQSYLKKYGDPNDPATREKALQAAVHAQRRLGELGNELGQERQANTEYQQMIAELQGIREAVSQQPQAPLDQATVDWFDQAVMQNPHQAMAWAQQQGNQMLVQRGLDTWKEVDPYGAATYRSDLQFQQYQQDVEKRLQAAQQLPVDANVNMALQAVRTRNPGFISYDEALADTLERYPYQAQQLQTAAASGNRDQLEGAIETLYALAERDTLRSLALSGEAPEQTTSTEQVATPTTSETREPAPEPSPLDEFRAAFKQEADHQRRGVWVAE